jgi:GTPase SAR1 family protein
MASGSQGNHSGGEARHPSVLIALMGETGVGKTSFARRVTGDDSIQFNSSLTPERAGAVRAYSLWLTSRDGGRRYHVTLIDCAGFDSIEEPDAAIINAIVDHLNVTYSRDQKLHGIIYTLDIT